MSDITLQKENVVKVVESEDAAARLEKRGFVRAGTPAPAGPGVTGNAVAEVEAMKKDMERASEAVETAEKLRWEAKKELEATKEQLEAANKEIAALNQELQGTREQLDTAVKKAAASAKKKE